MARLPQHAPVQPADDAEPEVALRGWQRPASRVLDDFALAEHRRSVGAAELALLDSQSGPFAARILTVRPTVRELAVDSAPFRVLLLRRLRLPLPLAPARCRCQRPLDVLGDHVAACPRSGTLRQRGGPLERAAARVCREAGTAVATNVLVRDLNLQTARQNERRIEVITNGLPVWGGSQLAVDTTLVSPLTSAGAPRRRGGATAGAALADARRSKERTYPEFGRASRCRLVVLGIEVGGRWSAEAASFVGCWLEHEHALPSLCSVQQPSLPSLGDGRGCCRLLQQGPSLPACSPCQSPISPMLTASLLCSATSSLTPPSHLLLPPAWRSGCVRERRAAGALVALGPRGWSQKGVWKKKTLCDEVAFIRFSGTHSLLEFSPWSPPPSIPCGRSP